MAPAYWGGRMPVVQHGRAGWYRTSGCPSLSESGHPCFIWSGRPLRLDAEVMMSEIDLERALNDPADLFESPDAVVHHPSLTREQKIQILNNWQLDASRLEGSEGEGMIGEDPPMLRRVRTALAALMEQPGQDAPRCGERRRSIL